MSKKAKTVFETNIPGLELATRGKVRDIYDLGDQALIVATDRLSAFDSVLATPIPLKGIILTKMAEFWFDFTKDVIKSHYITTDLSKMGHGLDEHADTPWGPVERTVEGWLAAGAPGGTLDLPELGNGTRDDQTVMAVHRRPASGRD